MKSNSKLGILLVAGSMLFALLPAAACEKPHVHTWVWHRSETEHYLECADPNCDAWDNPGSHEGGVCDVCAEFHVLAFGYTEGGDTAHSDFAREANEFFPKKGQELGFVYDVAGNDYSLLNDETLANYELVIFLNDRPHVEEQKEAFRRYMEGGGAWIGFHSAAFYMADAAEQSDAWDWYQNEFLKCGDYKNNTWDPTSEPLTVETFDFCATQYLPEVFDSAPCEWYGWQKDLFADPDIDVLLTLNPTQENPAGNNPEKDWEIWYDGHYPIAWTNRNYKMLYTNMGHNLQSYNHFEKESKTFSSEETCTFPPRRHVRPHEIKNSIY